MAARVGGGGYYVGEQRNPRHQDFLSEPTQKGQKSVKF